MKTKKALRLVFGLLVIGSLLMAGNFAWASPAAERPMTTHTKDACQGAELISMFETVDLGQGYTVTRGFQPDSLGVFADVYDLRLNGEQLAVVSAQLLEKKPYSFYVSVDTFSENGRINVDPTYVEVIDLDTSYSVQLIFQCPERDHIPAVVLGRN